MLNLLGTMPAAVAQIHVQRSFELRRLPQDWSAVLALGIVALGLWWIVRTYRAEARAGSTMPKRMFLAGLRATVFLLLMALWLEPVLATYFHRYVESYTLVLLDASASMKIRDHYLEPEEKSRLATFYKQSDDTPRVQEPRSREELLNLLLTCRDQEFLKRLTSRNAVKLYAFSEDAREVATLRARRGDEVAILEDHLDLDDAAFSFELDATGRATDLGRTLRKAVESVAGAPIAAVVVIGDGGFNQGEAIDVLGEFARAKNIPVHTVGVGDASAPRNARVVEMHVPPNVFVEDPFLITAGLETEGLTGQEVRVALTERPTASQGSAVLVAGKTVTAGSDGQIQALSFEHRQSKAGRYAYTLNIEPLAGESLLADNSRQAHANLLDNKMRVLLVSGGPGWSYRYLSRLLQRDRTVDVSCWLQSADRAAVRDGDTVIDHLPDNAQELFEYDAIVLLDPDPAGLSRRWAELVDRHVTRNGAGLLYSAARKYSPRFFHQPDTEALIRLLPVTPSPEVDLILNQIGYYQARGSTVEFPKSALRHPLFAEAAGDASSADIWKRISRVYWHFPVKSEKPAATVLMRHAHPRMRNAYGGHVLLATQFVGAGRTAFVGFDGTWRWRRYGEALYNQFWVRLLRFLAEGKLLGGQTRGRIQTDQDTYQVGDVVVFTARLLDARFEPLGAARVDLSLSGAELPRERVIRLRQDAQRPGWYRGQLRVEQRGTYVASIQLPAGRDQRQIRLTREFEVKPSDLEMLQPQMARGPLKTLARLSAGGRHFEMDQVYALPDGVADRHETRITEGTPEPLWDSAWLLLLLVVLLGTEWALRKKWQLL